jgi:hypothetical protein
MKKGKRKGFLGKMRFFEGIREGKRGAYVRPRRANVWACRNLWGGRKVEDRGWRIKARRHWAGSRSVGRGVGMKGGGSPRKEPQSMAAGAFKHVPRKILRILGFFGKTWEKTREFAAAAMV